MSSAGSSARRETEALASLASRLGNDSALRIDHVQSSDRSPLKSIDNAVFEDTPVSTEHSNPKRGLEVEARTLQNSLVRNIARPFSVTLAR